MKTTNRNRYAAKYAKLGEISSLNELKQMQDMVGHDMNRSRKRIVKKYENAVDSFSLRSLFCGLLNRVAVNQPVVRYAMYGYDFVNSIVSGRRGRR